MPAYTQRDADLPVVAGLAGLMCSRGLHRASGATEPRCSVGGGLHPPSTTQSTSGTSHAQEHTGMGDMGSRESCFQV